MNQNPNPNLSPNLNLVWQHTRQARMAQRCLGVLSLGLLCLGLGGCAVTPSSIVNGKTTAEPEPIAEQPRPMPGAIYATSGYRPLFEDARARQVGDILTLVISEKAAADKKSGLSDNRKGQVSIGVDQFFALPLSTADKLGFKSSSEFKNSATGAGSASATFSTTMGVTVVGVLPNGNLKIAGEKQIGLDRGTEFIRFSGVVPANAIGPQNVIQSARVADARLEYRTNSQIDAATVLDFFNRFFFNLILL